MGYNFQSGSRSASLRTFTLCVALMSAWMVPACAEGFTGKVVSVVDGDTLNVDHNGVKEKVILYGIDCPEISQDFGAEARKFTDNAAYGKLVTIEQHGRDKHDRIIADVLLSDGSNLNQELVRRGLAWWSDKFAPNDQKLKTLHANAKAAHKGLWSASNPIPPWIFRNGERKTQAQILIPSKSSP